MWMFGNNPELVAEEDALHGGKHPVLENPRPHAVLGTPITGIWELGQASLIVGLGCFWGVEKLYWNLDGVVSTSAGYAGGVTPNPTYREVCTGRTNHVEVVRVVYDPSRVSLEDLVRVGLEAHDPTQGYRQGNDVGTQYRSAIYCTSPQQLEEAKASRDTFQAELNKAGFGEITTEIDQAPTVYFAEAYHQQYLAKNPDGYCGIGGTGVCLPPSLQGN